MGNTQTFMKLVLGATALTMISTGSAFAAGTDAGTSVLNTFTLDYQVGSTPQTTIDNTAAPTEFIVDRIVDLNVDAGADTNVVPGSTDQVLTYTLTNEGNGTQDFDTLFTQLGGTDDEFDPTATTISYTYTDDTATVVTGTATPGTAFVIDNLPADGVVTFTVEGDIDLAQVDGDTAEITLTATALTEAGTAITANETNELLDEETIYGDAAGLTGDVVEDGVHSDAAEYIVVTAQLTGDKVVDMIATEATDAECQNFATAIDAAAYAIPGSCVQYTISVTNDAAASASATDIAVSDTLEANLIFQDAQSSGFTTAGTLVEPSPATACTGTAGTVAVPGVCDVYLTGASLDAGATGLVTIRATVK